MTFFHLGKYFRTPVHMYVLAARRRPDPPRSEILYDPDYFSMPADSPAQQLPRGAGFAGFRFQESRSGDQQKLDWHTNDWVAFLGASYFRAIGELYQYGLSARGVALECGARPITPRSFPISPASISSRPADGSHDVILYAALEGPSITGAYRFVMQRDKAVVMEIEARLFLRQRCRSTRDRAHDIDVLVLRDHQANRHDWRPEVHDSDGLAHVDRYRRAHLAAAQQHRASLDVSAFADKSPKGFGLLQRDRVFRPLSRRSPLRASPEPVGRALG